MFDSIFDIMIVLIPLAIFIGRIVLKGQSKRKPAPLVKQRPIPVHFEDYKDDEDEAPLAPQAVSRPVLTVNNSEDIFSQVVSMNMNSVPKPPLPKRPGSPSAEPASNYLNLNHLSPMKQAVVMAEILGTPKGMQ